MIRHRRNHWYNFSLKTFKKLGVIHECMSSKDMEKITIGKKLLHTSSIPFFPYSFTDHYVPEKIKVIKDEDGYPFVIHGDQRLYLKKE